MAETNDTPEVMSRQQAIECGADHYFTGTPCANEHMSRRRVKTRQCLACVREATAKHRAADPVRQRRLACAPVPMHPELVISRQQAKAAGFPHYFTGIPCINGHLSERMTKGKLCLACHRERRARLRASDPTRIKAQKAKSYRNRRIHVLESVHRYQRANVAKIRAAAIKRRAKDKPGIAARYKAWAALNRDILRVHERTRRARKKRAEGTHTLADIKRIFAAQKGCCAAPGCSAKLADGYHVDHITPLARGGTNWPRNIQLLCPPCNHSKHARDPIEWAQSLGRLL